MSQGEVCQNGEKVLVALGSNATSHAGEPRETVLQALEMLASVFGIHDDFETSKLYHTPAFPAGSGPDFINAACSFSTMRAPRDILAECHRIEAVFHRQRVQRWGQRTLDLDLIAHGQSILPDLATFNHWYSLPLEAQKAETPDMLILPHPRVQDRSFVLVPLADVAPDWRHPSGGLTVLEMLANRPTDERDEVVGVT